jgi:anaerobic selenocysteine-containing dehydrogenase
MADGQRGTVVEERKSFCRTCTSHCGVLVGVDAHEHIVSIRPDKEDPITKGFACFKGLTAGEAHYSQKRVLHPLKRMPDGTFQRIGIEQALDEIAEKLKDIIARHGPMSVGGYRGTGSGMNAAGCFSLDGLFGAIGTPKICSASSIDQSSKTVAMERMGYWPPGTPLLDEVEVALFFGLNPMVSYSSVELHNTVKSITGLVSKGLKLLVVDPRKTETARIAHTYVQPLPGEDSFILAGMIRHILKNGWEDKAFIEKNVAQVEDLRAVVEPFTPELVCKRADIPVDKFLAMTEMFAKAKKKFARAGTGPSMGPHSNLMEHLVQALNVITGCFLREGDEIRNPGFLMQRFPRKCQVIPAQRSYDKGFKSRLGDFGLIKLPMPEMPTGLMADEILTPGPGQIKAFFVHGGNPAIIVPDQLKVVRAFKELELLVTIDPFMTPTAELSHYVLPTTMQYERPDLPCWQGEVVFYKKAYSRYTPAVAKPPAGAEVVDDTYIVWGIAKRMGLQFTSLGEDVDMGKAPDTEDILAIVARHAPVPYDELKQAPLGLFHDEPQYAEAGDPGPDDRFTVCPPDVVQEMKDLAVEPAIKDVTVANGMVATHRFTVRRHRDIWNSTFRENEPLKKRVPHNTAFMNPDDLKAMGLKAGDAIRLSTVTTTVEVIVDVDENVRSGVVSMSHGFGALPEKSDYKRDGLCSNILITTDRDLQTINAMPRMSGFALHVSPADRRNAPLN